jgi:3-hydroxyacyl-CoA dehydrogenase
MHLFNPVPVLSLVEEVPSWLTDADVTSRVKSFAADQLGKHRMVALAWAGFTVNTLVILDVLLTIRTFEQKPRRRRTSTRRWSRAAHNRRDPWCCLV